MAIKRRVFISVQNPRLLDVPRLALQEGVIRRVEALGFQPEIFFMAGDAETTAWSLQNLSASLRGCVGVVVLAFRRWTSDGGDGARQGLASEYAQVEGAMASALQLPLFIAVERGVAERGITWTGAGNRLTFMPEAVDAAWLETEAFERAFGAWAGQLQQRHDVFLGYCSRSHATASALNRHLVDTLDLKVLDWKTGFAAGGIILDEIEAAARSCTGGIFLFTRDDALEGAGGDTGDLQRAAPRDNVVFEAGYFAAARGRSRVLIILERGARMPADLGGNIYLPLDDRDDLAPITAAIGEFVAQRL